ncbi:MAG: hypothetical protein R3F11_07745 [Verrucomicrobiales bacterium]
MLCSTLPSQTRKVIALDAATGKNCGNGIRRRNSEPGAPAAALAHWENGDGGEVRIFTGVQGGQIASTQRTGEVIRELWRNGSINLNSPSIPGVTLSRFDHRRRRRRQGAIRAYDVRTGEQR